MNNRTLLRVSIAITALVLSALLAWLSLDTRLTGNNRLANAVQIGGPFVLASAKGGTVSSESLKGKPYGVFFGFTHCPEVCPTTMFEMSETMRAMGNSADDFRLFFITVDPERDTAEMLSGYVANFDPRIDALVPTLAELPPLAKAFRVIYEKVPTSDGSYTMNHTATIFLFGRDGQFRSTIAYGEARDMREQKLRALLKH